MSLISFVVFYLYEKKNNERKVSCSCLLDEFMYKRNYIRKRLSKERKSIPDISSSCLFVIKKDRSETFIFDKIRQTVRGA